MFTRNCEQEPVVGGWERLRDLANCLQSFVSRRIYEAVDHDALLDWDTVAFGAITVGLSLERYKSFENS